MVEPGFTSVSVWLWNLHSQPFLILPSPGLFSALPRQKGDFSENGLGFGPLPHLDIPSPPIIINCFLTELLPWSQAQGRVPTLRDGSSAPWDVPWKRGSLVKVRNFALFPTLWPSQKTPTQESFYADPQLQSPVQLALFNPTSLNIFKIWKNLLTSHKSGVLLTHFANPAPEPSSWADRKWFL